MADSAQQKTGAAEAASANSETPTQRPLAEASTHSVAGTPTPSSAASLAPGSLLGPYRLQEKLGEGGMGAVYKAVHEHLDKVVAIKVLPAALTQQADAVARFRQEMKAVGKVEHPNIVRAMDAGEIGGIHFLAMEYVEGTELARYVQAKGPMSVPNACKAVRQAALALAAAHAAGLIHRDVKPSNLLVAKTGQIKLLDLGLARLASDKAQHTRDLTAAGQTFGTPDYMAPEQWEDAHAVDARTDLYALGCTLCFLLTGRAPFATEDSTSLFQKLQAHCSKTPPDLRELVPGLPEGVAVLFEKLLSKRREDRFHTAVELAEALLPYTKAATEPPASSPAVPVPAAVASPPSPASLKASRPRLDDEPPQPLPSFKKIDRKPKSKPVQPGLPKWLIPVAGGAGALLLLGVIVIVITNRDGTQTKIEVPGDSKVEVSHRDEAPATLPSANTTGSADVNSEPPVDPDSLTAQPLDRSPAEQGSPPGAPQVAPPSPPQTVATQPTATLRPTGEPPHAVAPFDAEQAKNHQEAWAAYLGVPVETTNSIGIRLRLIPPGEYLMGSTAEQVEASLKLMNDNASEGEKNRVRNEAPQQLTAIDRPLLVGATEVTIGQFRKFIESTKYMTDAERQGGGRKSAPGVPTGVQDATLSWSAPGYPITDDSPVTQVSWDDAAAFCNWLSGQEKFSSSYEPDAATAWKIVRNGAGYRLATSAEWEFVCRAGTTTLFSFGDDPALLDKYGWFDGNSNQQAQAVGVKLPNAFGIHDIHGNVQEWTQTYFPESKNFAYRDAPWRAVQMFVFRSAAHRSHKRDYRHQQLGFRVVRTLPLPAPTPQTAVAETPTKETPTVAVSSIPKPSTPPPPEAEKKPTSALPTTAPIQLRVAEMVLRLGGSVRGVERLGQAAGSEIARLEEVPPEPFVFTAVDLDGRLGVSVDDFSLLRELPYLETLYLAGTGVGDGSLESLRQLAGLGQLGLDNTAITDAGAGALASHADLYSLHVAKTRLTDNACREIKKLVRLRTLDLSSTAITDAGLKEISVLPALRTLILEKNTALTKDGVAHLRSLPLLQDLRLSGTSIGDEIVDVLAQFPRLRFVDLKGSKVTSEGALRLQAALPKAVVVHPAVSIDEDQRSARWVKEHNGRTGGHAETLVTGMVAFPQNGPRPAGGVEYLLGMRSLGIAALQRALPECAIFFTGGSIVPGWTGYTPFGTAPTGTPPAATKGKKPGKKTPGKS